MKRLLPTPEAQKGSPLVATRNRRISAAAISALAIVIVTAVVVVVFAATRGTSATPNATATQTAAPSSGKWLSGESGNGVTNGSFAKWRGRPVGIIGTWADDNTNQVQFYQLHKGGDFASYTGPMDMAVGAIGANESWAHAATGAYNARWTTSLEKLKGLRASATGTTYIRFAHEMNGDWYPWKVTASNYRDFLGAWKQYRALQRKIFPEAKLVFSVNRESVGTGMDWTKFFPGKQYVDVLSVDYYNQNPAVMTAARWASSIQEKDQWGGPKGLAQHLAFASKVGLPLAISEWSTVADAGDSAEFVTQFLHYVRAHSGAKAGQIPYEILFDVPQNNNKFTLFGAGAKMPLAAAAYQKFFSQ